jgi:hypothetical protein
MKTLLTTLVAACTLAALPALADHGGVVKRNIKTTLSVSLSPTADAPVGATGDAEIRIQQHNDRQKAGVRLEVSGLAVGDYTLNATLSDASVAIIGTFHVGTHGVPVEPGEDDGRIHFHIPDTLDATLITGLNVTDASAVILLQGSTTLDAHFVNFFANVPVTAPLVTTSSNGHTGKRVHGHALAQSTIEDGVELKRHFLWVAFGAPASTELTINVDGVAVGTVTSTKQGKVMFHSLDASVDLSTMKLITLTDATAAVIMEAQF